MIVLSTTFGFGETKTLKGPGCEVNLCPYCSARSPALFNHTFINSISGKSFHLYSEAQGNISELIRKNLILFCSFHSIISFKSITFCNASSDTYPRPFSSKVRLIIERFVVTLSLSEPNCFGLDKFILIHA